MAQWEIEIPNTYAKYIGSNYELHVRLAKQNDYTYTCNADVYVTLDFTKSDFWATLDGNSNLIILRTALPSFKTVSLGEACATVATLAEDNFKELYGLLTANLEGAKIETKDSLSPNIKAVASSYISNI